VYEYNELTQDELIEDVIARAFAMMLGVHMPSPEALTLMQTWIKIIYILYVKYEEDFVKMQNMWLDVLPKNHGIKILSSKTHGDNLSKKQTNKPTMSTKTP